MQFDKINDNYSIFLLPKLSLKSKNGNCQTDGKWVKIVFADNAGKKSLKTEEETNISM